MDAPSRPCARLPPEPVRAAASGRKDGAASARRPWLAERKFFKEATRHALAAGDERLAQASASQGLWSLATSGNLVEALQWLPRLAPETLAGDVELRLHGAWIMALADRTDEARRIADETLRNPSSTPEMAFMAALVASAAEACSDRLGAIPRHPGSLAGAAGPRGRSRATPGLLQHARGRGAGRRRSCARTHPRHGSPKHDEQSHARPRLLDFSDSRGDRIAARRRPDPRGRASAARTHARGANARQAQHGRVPARGRHRRGAARAQRDRARRSNARSSCGRDRAIRSSRRYRARLRNPGAARRRAGRRTPRLVGARQHGVVRPRSHDAAVRAREPRHAHRPSRTQGTRRGGRRAPARIGRARADLRASREPAVPARIPAAARDGARDARARESRRRNRARPSSRQRRTWRARPTSHAKRSPCRCCARSRRICAVRIVRCLSSRRP